MMSCHYGRDSSFPTLRPPLGHTLPQARTMQGFGPPGIKTRRAPSLTQIRDEHHLKLDAGEIQLIRLAPVDEPRFIDVKAATRALMPGPQKGQRTVAPSKFENEK